MTTISAKVIADSTSRHAPRLTTLQLRYPRFIHAESQTHRVLSETGELIQELLSLGVMNEASLSRNARSSRAVPVPRMIQEAIDDPVIPIHWGAAQKGMQAYGECSELVEVPNDLGFPRWLSAEDAWLHARNNAVRSATAFHNAGYAKQVVNRLLEPFLHIDTLVSGTQWDNFLWLRDHHMAEPHIEALAKAIRKALDESTPKLLGPGQWHLPYVTPEDVEAAVEYGLDQPESGDWNPLVIVRKLSVARSARISYEPFDGDGSIPAEVKRYDFLVGSSPLHASPAEHQATPDKLIDPDALVPQFQNPELGGNLGPGWVQFRKTLPGENYIAKAA